MLLKIDNIYVNYGSFQALHGVSLEVKEGEVVGLLGSNGAGKSTTIKTISGQLSPQKGDVFFQNKSITALPIHERVALGLAQVPEGRRLFPYLSVEDNLIAGSFLKNARKERKENLEYCYTLFPKLGSRKKQLAGSLSGGEQQMCAIARGLMQKPKLMMLDEPSLGLAPIVVESIFETIQSICKRGVAVLLVEQNVAFTLEVASHIFVIETGSNVMNGSGAQLKNDPKLQKAYLGI
jgi:branched-chain amino acid transport system ATP-binding protein